MEADAAGRTEKQPSPAPAGAAEELEGRRGAGGKMIRRSLRRGGVPATPYDRPRGAEDGGAGRGQQTQRDKGWLSRLVLDPASRILPSFLPSSSGRPPQTVSFPAPLEIEQGSHNDIPKVLFDDQISQSGEPCSSAGADHPEGCYGSDELTREKLKNACDGSGLVDIELRLKQKTFSRDESNRLIELLRSRTIDFSDDDGLGIGFVAHGAGNARSQKDLGRSEEKQFVQLDHRVHQVPDKVGSSPVEIGKAYMEARTSASDHSFQGGLLKNDRTPLRNDDSAATMFTPLAHMSQVCWPGAVVPGDHSYFTPQSQRGRIGLHRIPQTPYSGEVFPRFTSKFRDGCEIPPKESIGWKKSSTPVFGALQRKRTILDDGLTSITPLPKVNRRNMTASASKGVDLSNSAIFTPPPSASSYPCKGFASSFQGKLESGSSRSSIFKFQATHARDIASKHTVGSSTVHPQSSELARKILEHLDRIVPCPKEKSVELKQAIEKKKFPLEGTADFLNGRDNRPDQHSSRSHSTSFLLGWDGIRGNTDAQKDFVETSSSKVGDRSNVCLDHPETSKKCILGLTCSVANSEVLQVEAMPLHRSFGSEHNSSSISIAKADEKQSSASDNGFVFSFLVSASSNVFREPHSATTMAPSSSANVPEAKEGTIPSFNFGSSSAGSGPVFSFDPIVSSTFTNNSVPQYKFGSDKKTNVSFRSFGRDAIRC